MNCIVWFNGPSSKKLHHIKKVWPEIGCNHIRNDRAVDYVCVYDPRTKPEITIEDGVKYVARNGSRDDTFMEITYPMANQPGNSGMLAVLLACKLGFKNIYIIGCDWGISVDTIYQKHYKVKAEFKHNNDMKTLLKNWINDYKVKITVISDAKPDLPVEVLRIDNFLSVLDDVK